MRGSVSAGGGVMDRDDEIWERMLIWTSEQTGVSKLDIEAVIAMSNAFWMTHMGLAKLFMTEEDE